MASSILPHLGYDGGWNGVHDGRDGGLRQVVCPELKTLVVDFRFASETINGGRCLGIALKDGDMAVLEADLRDRCAELEGVLHQRSEKGGPNITRLEFGCTEVDSVERSDTECRRTIDVSGVPWRSVVESLERLVDETVIFTGYHYFSADER